MALNTKTCTLILTLYVLATTLSSHQAASLTPPRRDLTMLQRYEQWMSEHGRVHVNMEEKQKRFEIFKENVEQIERHNQDQSKTYKLAINRFADLSEDEFLAKYNGYSSKPMTAQPTEPTSGFIYENVTNVPSSLDWRERGAVTPVQLQGPCGCCWAFSAVAAIEGIVHVRTGSTASLSEQQILDCNSQGEGCSGGRMEHAFEYMRANGGLASDADYPYQTSQGACGGTLPSSLATPVTGFGRVPPNNESAMLQAVANQPVSVGIDPSMFRFYKSGVLMGPCGYNLAHAITAVGYGTSKEGIKYWLFKNSWGPEWGDGGYIKLQRDIGDPRGMCGLAMDLTFPIA